jgi:hypothetical protein
MKPPIKPKKPAKPTAPVESYEIPCPAIVIEMGSRENVPLTEIIDRVKKQIPEGEIFNISQLSFDISCYSDCYDYGDAKFVYTINKKITRVDKDFARKHKEYLVRLQKYETALAEYNQKLFMYEIASKEYTDFLKSEEIRKAKEVLAANGFKI